nr:hypothetical protein [Streptomyces sp. NBC_01497]
MADSPVGGPQIAVRVQLRRLACPAPGCRRQTSREKLLD